MNQELRIMKLAQSGQRILQNVKFRYIVTSDITSEYMEFFFQLSYAEIAFLLSLSAITALLGWNLRLERKLNRLLIGGKSKTLDEVLSLLKEKMDSYEDFKEELEEYLTTAESRIRKSVQGVSTIRFNPFKGGGQGGNQSFATAFINQNGDGIIISTLYSRDHISIFAKPIEKFTSEFELTAEEKMAMLEAKEKVS